MRRLSKTELLAARALFRSRFARVAGPFLLILLGALSGCSSRRPTAPPPLPPRAVDAPAPVRRDVAILYNNAGGYADVANQLRKLLPAETYRLTVVDIDAPNSSAAVTALRGKPGLFAVAIGLPAARVARDKLTGPVIFAQVFNYQELMVGGRTVRGVAAMPPLTIQVQDWKKLDPKLRRVGLIISQPHSALVEEAQRAAKAAALTMRHEISASDRETLYLFKRLAPQIDGLWLVPDDRILSPGVLRELLGYAVAHGVRVCVFSDSLLQLGALMSASATPEDTARTVRRVLDSMMARGGSSVPALTQLSEVGIRINTQVAGRLGLPVPAKSTWVSRGAR